MFNFTYEKEGNNSFVVYKVDQERLDKFTQEMLLNNDIFGLARPIVSQLDNDVFLKYNVSAKVQASNVFADKIQRDRLIGIFKGVLEAYEEIQNYMIPANTLVLNLDHIYVDITDNTTSMLCIPFMHDGEEKDLSQFFKEILFSGKFDQSENLDYVAKLINTLNSMPVFSTSVLLEEVNKLAKTPVERKPDYRAKVEARPVAMQEVKEIKTETKKTVDDYKLDASPKFQPMFQAKFEDKSEVVNTPFAVPQVEAKPASEQKVQKESTGGENRVTLLNLLTSYSKEKHQLYKEQKAEAKEAGSQKAPKEKASKKSSKGSSSKKSAKIEGEITLGSLLTSYSKEKHQLYKEQKAAKKANAKSGNVEENAVHGKDMFISHKAGRTPVVEESPQVQVAVEAKPEIKKPVQEKRDSGPIRPAAAYGTFGETTVLGESGGRNETTVLSAFSQQAVERKPYLIRKNNGERVMINKPLFKIGTEVTYVDYEIKGNSAISRSHANILIVDDAYYLEDTNSTNHTYLNNEMLTPNRRILINDGDVIKFANEEFEFKMI